MENQSISIATSMDTWQKNADQRKKKEKQGDVSSVIKKGIQPKIQKELDDKEDKETEFWRQFSSKYDIRNLSYKFSIQIYYYKLKDQYGERIECVSKCQNQEQKESQG